MGPIPVVRPHLKPLSIPQKSYHSHIGVPIYGPFRSNGAAKIGNEVSHLL